MAKGEQIDKVSKKYVRLSQRDLKHAKRMHKRYIRRMAKMINEPHPQPNRYDGYIG